MPNIPNLAGRNPLILNSVKNTFLVATQDLNGTPFERAVIYMVDYGDHGAMGLMVNHPVKQISFREIAAGMGIEEMMREGTNAPIILRGGPVDHNRGFVLHTGDYHLPGTRTIGPDVSLSATADIVNDIAQGRGPRQMNFCLGCAAWSPGQLDTELHDNGWLVVPASPEILFELPAEQRYDACTQRLGLDALNFSETVGLA